METSHTSKAWKDHHVQGGNHAFKAWKVFILETQGTHTFAAGTSAFRDMSSILYVRKQDFHGSKL